MALRTYNLGIAAIGVISAAASISCGARSANQPAPATASAPAPGNPADDDISASVVEHHRHHHHGGVTLLIAMSLDTIGVSPDEKAAVEKIQSDLRAEMAPARVAEENLDSLLADGIAAGSIDTARVDAAIAQLTAAAATVHDAATDAVNQLHATLTPPERAALIDKVNAHWVVWQRANADESGAKKSEQGHLSTLAGELGLTPDQVEKIRAALATQMSAVPHLDAREVETDLHAFGEAFRGDKFDSKALTMADSVNQHMAAWGATHMAHFLEAVSPVLTPDQRADLAARLREHSTHGPSAGATP